MEKILVISAHPDDNLSCAGSLFKLKAAGCELYEVVLAYGDEGFNRQGKKLSKKAMKELRGAEFKKAAKFLGMKEIWFAGFSDFTIKMDKKIMFWLVGIIRKLQPVVIFMQNEFDYGTDHIQASKLSYEAVNIAASKLRPELGESWRTPIVLTMEGVPAMEKPAVLIDISEVYPKKLELLALYGSQTDSRLQKFTQGFALHRGALARTDFAEAFGIYPNMPILINNKVFKKLFGGKDE